MDKKITAEESFIKWLATYGEEHYKATRYSKYLMIEFAEQYADERLKKLNMKRVKDIFDIQEVVRKQFSFLEKHYPKAYKDLQQRHQNDEFDKTK